MMRVILSLIVCSGLFADVRMDYQTARELADGGKVEEAFLKFVAIPGGESSAMALARGEAERFLKLLQADAELTASPRGRLIEAELMLASGLRDEAVERVKGLSGVENWGADYFYPVEVVKGSGVFRLSIPFYQGPGSHRDNRLLRRLLALDLKDEAAREFARIWELHRKRGFDGQGRQFSVDYAFFLKKSGLEDQAAAVLLGPLRGMDMDRLPRIDPMQSMLFGPRSTGLSRKDFIRLATGEFKQAGRMNVLLDELNRQIAAGENRARKVLAQVRLHEGDATAAMALEMEFIAKGGFNAPSAAYRRGMVFEANGMMAEAAEAFEQAMAADGKMLMDVPDGDEPIDESSHGMFRLSPATTTVVQMRQPLRKRLVRLYVGLGAQDKVLEMEFAAMEEDPSLLEHLQMLEERVVRMRTAGQEARFVEWAKGMIAKVESPGARAHLSYVIQDYPAAVRHAAESYRGNYSERDFWRANFSKIDARHELDYLRAVVAARPEDALARLDLLGLEGDVDGPDAITVLELLLETDEDEAFPYHRRVTPGPAGFTGYFDLSYRLMRLYERHRRLYKLRTLGLRMAREEPPFANFDKHGFEGIGVNGREEYGNACLALAIQHAEDPSFQNELAAALETSRWAGARAQMARRMKAESATTDTKPSPPWANLPSGTRVVVSCESVACAVRSDRHVYAGLPWGVAVYDLKGAPVTRILLGAAVTHLVAVDGQIWVGADTGVFRITEGDWTVAHEPLGKMVALGLDGDDLWIGSSESGLFVLNRKTLEMLAISADEIGSDRTTDFTRFEADGRYLWADRYDGVLRYERATGIWTKVENPWSNSAIHLIGIVDGEVWVDVWLNDKLRHRPARLDRETLEMEPMEMRGNKPRDNLVINSDLRFAGHHHGQPVFATDGGYGGRFLMEAGSHTMRRMQEEEAGISHPVRDEIAALPKHAWPDGLRDGVRSTRYSDRWPSDAVWAVGFDDDRKQEWLCVAAGLAVMPRDGKALKHFDSAEGLTRGPVLDAAELGGKWYFGSAWDDHRGALTMFDPDTGVFVPWFRPDGMDSNKVVGLAAKDGKLEVRYGVEYPGDDTENDLAPGMFDPATGVFTPGEGKIKPVEGQRPAPAVNGTLPVLGGDGYRSYFRDGMTWHCGARGLAIFPGTQAPEPVMEKLQVKRMASPVEVAQSEAAKVEISDPIPAEMLRELLKHENPYVRFRAVKATSRPLRTGQTAEYAPILMDAMNDTHAHVRAIAVWNLSQCADPAAWLPLREAMDETDPGIHAMAMVAMAKRGEMPPLEHFVRVMKHNNHRSSFRYDGTSSFSVGASDDDVFTALARHADRAVFDFLLNQAPPNLYYVGPACPEFGESLRKHPDAVPVLLSVVDQDRSATRRLFVQTIFQHAGPEMLPLLHAALRSEDRVVRSNAARACGAIGDASSVPHLMEALDMESNLSRASIIWALGELKAVEAIPRLVAFHQSERSAEQSRQEGRGMLAMNSNDGSEMEYAVLSNLDVIESDWNELKANALATPRDPKHDEDLLTPEHILEAVRKIGTAGLREFHRTLAASSHITDRMEATIGLAQADEDSREDNRAILRNLMADQDRKVRVSACVSLHLLGGPEMKEAWKAGDAEERLELLRQTQRIPVALLEQVRQEIEAMTNDPLVHEHYRNSARNLLREMDCKR